MPRLISILLLCHSLEVLSIAYDPLVVTNIQDWPGSLGQLNYITDNNLNTEWVSNACRAGGWKKSKKQNGLYNVCSVGMCSASCTEGNLSYATDGSPYTSSRAKLNHATGLGWANFPFAKGNAQIAQSIYIRGGWPVNTTVYATVPSGSPIRLGTLGPQDNYLDIVYAGPSVPITGVRVQTATRDGLMRGYCYAGIGDCKTLMVTEIAAQTVECYEEITLDLGAVKEVNRLSMAFGSIYSGKMASSVDGNSFVNRLDLKTFTTISSRRLRADSQAITPSAVTPTVVNLPSTTARYLRFR
jgi:hypothetical protein